MPTLRFELPGFRARAKARPVSGKGRMYMPKPYQDWKATIRSYLASRYAPTPVLGPCAIHIDLHAPTKPRGDLDNLAGGLLDAIQPPRARGDVRAQRELERHRDLEARLKAAPGALIGDDGQVEHLAIRWVRSPEVAIVLVVEDLSDLGRPSLQ